MAKRTIMLVEIENTASGREKLRIRIKDSWDIMIDLKADDFRVLDRRGR